MQLQPGIKRILDLILHKDSILDLGCGNGELALTLQKQGYCGSYVGLDFSPELLEIAKQRIQARESPIKPSFYFLSRDIATSKWTKRLPFSGYNLVLALAVLHHIPSFSLRFSLLKKIRALLIGPKEKQQNPILIHSVWQFLNSPRLKSRVVAWEKIGLSPQDVETGDYLLDWRSGGYSLRYVHHFNEIELMEMANMAGFQVVDTFYSDGENSRLGLYQIWQAA
jgi:SAM-dependent methyltransferase